MSGEYINISHISEDDICGPQIYNRKWFQLPFKPSGILNGMAVTKYLENIVLLHNIQNIEMKIRKN